MLRDDQPVHEFCYSVFSNNIEHSGTDLGDWRRRWREEWQTERVRPRDPFSLSAKSLSVPLRSHVDHLQPTFVSCEILPDIDICQKRAQAQLVHLFSLSRRNLNVI